MLSADAWDPFLCLCQGVKIAPIALRFDEALLSHHTDDFPLCCEIANLVCRGLVHWSQKEVPKLTEEFFDHSGRNYFQIVEVLVLLDFKAIQEPLQSFKEDELLVLIWEGVMNIPEDEVDDGNGIGIRHNITCLVILLDDPLLSNLVELALECCVRVITLILKYLLTASRLKTRPDPFLQQVRDERII